MMWFLLGIVIAGLKFPYNLLFPNVQFSRFRQTKNFGLTTGERLNDAWNRFWDSGRPFHDLTNLAIEWNREWLPLSTKFLSSLFVYSNLLWLIGLILSWL
jgi:hypothetical protein